MKIEIEQQEREEIISLNIEPTSDGAFLFCGRNKHGNWILAEVSGTGTIKLNPAGIKQAGFKITN